MSGQIDISALTQEEKEALADIAKKMSAKGAAKEKIKEVVQHYYDQNIVPRLNSKSEDSPTKKERQSPPNQNFGAGSSGSQEQPGEPSNRQSELPPLEVAPLESERADRYTSPLAGQFQRDEFAAQEVDKYKSDIEALKAEALVRRTSEQFGHDEDISARIDAALDSDGKVFIDTESYEPISVNEKEADGMFLNVAKELSGRGMIGEFESLDKVPEDELKHIAYVFGSRYLPAENIREIFDQTDMTTMLAQFEHLYPTSEKGQ